MSHLHFSIFISIFVGCLSFCIFWRVTLLFCDWNYFVLTFVPPFIVWGILCANKISSLLVPVSCPAARHPSGNFGGGLLHLSLFYSCDSGSCWFPCYSSLDILPMTARETDVLFLQTSLRGLLSFDSVWFGRKAMTLKLKKTIQEKGSRDSRKKKKLPGAAAVSDDDDGLLHVLLLMQLLL